MFSPLVATLGHGHTPRPHVDQSHCSTVKWGGGVNATVDSSLYVYYYYFSFSAVYDCYTITMVYGIDKPLQNGGRGELRRGRGLN